MCRLTREDGSEINPTDKDFGHGHRCQCHLFPSSANNYRNFENEEISEKNKSQPKLANEIQHLIKRNKFKHSGGSFTVSEQTELDEEETTESFDGLIPEKKLIQCNQKYGLITNPCLRSKAFHICEPREQYSMAGESSMSLSELNSKISQVLSGQQSLLKAVKTQTASLSHELETIKQSFQRLSELASKEPELSVVPKIETPASNLDKIENINKFSLLAFLCPKQNFRYSIEPSAPLDINFVKERNFRADFKIVDKEAKSLLADHQGIFLEMKLYSAENPPKVIEFNTCGNSIFKGLTVREVKDGLCTFEKVQIKEVSSHFRNGWVFLVVQAKNIGGGENKDALVTDIQPFILDNIIIKAKLNSKRKENDPADCCQHSADQI